MKDYSHNDPDAEIVLALKAEREPDPERLRAAMGRVKAFICHKWPTLIVDADELTQETMVRACEKIHTFEWGSLFATWLVGIARNVVREHCRDKDNQAARGVDALLDEASDDADPERDALHRMAYEEAVGLLDALERRVFELRFNDDTDFKEIAAACGVEPAKAQQIMYRAVRKIKRYWTDNNW